MKRKSGEKVSDEVVGNEMKKTKKDKPAPKVDDGAHAKTKPKKDAKGGVDRSKGGIGKGKPTFVKGKPTFVKGKPTFVKGKGKDAGKAPPAAQKPPDWAKFKKEKKLVRDARRRAGVEPELQEAVSRAKVIGEKLRRKNGTAEERSKLTDELHALLKQKDNYRRLALAHDTSRIIQWLMKFGPSEVREEASATLADIVVEMLQSKYARNTVKRILKYGSTATRDKILRALNGNVVKLASHALSSPILDYAYGEIASKIHKLLLRQEFYGDIYKMAKDETVKTLSDTYKSSPEMKTAMLTATKANLLRTLNKNVHDCSLVHAILLEYLNECSPADRSELITTISPNVAPLSNSKSGVRAAMLCVWHGTNKDKKTILKVLKEQGTSLATHEHGHLLILSVLSSIDDTVLVNKVLISTLLKDVKSLAKEEWGRKVILWLVAPEDKNYFHPSFLEWLNTGLKKGTSKKPSEQRASELLKEALPQLCNSIQEDTEFWLSNGSLSLTALAIIKAATGSHLETCLDSISKFICDVSWKVRNDDKEVDGIEHPGLHLTFKKLAQHDKINTEKNEYTFGASLSKILTQEVVEFWITTNRGCFFLITVFENNSSHVQEKIKELLSPISKKLKKQSTAGSKILLTKISK